MLKFEQARSSQGLQKFWENMVARRSPLRNLHRLGLRKKKKNFFIAVLTYFDCMKPTPGSILNNDKHKQLSLSIATRPTPLVQLFQNEIPKGPFCHGNQSNFTIFTIIPNPQKQFLRNAT